MPDASRFCLEGESRAMKEHHGVVEIIFLWIGKKSVV